MIAPGFEAAALRGSLPWATSGLTPAPGGYLYQGKPDLARLNRQIMAERPATRNPAGTHAEHGTNARARKHRRDGEKPCEACREAEARARTPNPQPRKSRQGW